MAPGVREGGVLSLDDPLTPGPSGSGNWTLWYPRQGRRGLRLGPQGCANTGQLYFGNGSKLTVLGKEAAGGRSGPWGGWRKRSS